MFFTLRISKSNLENIQIQSEVEFCRQEIDKPRRYILFGKIYEEPNISLKILSQKLSMQDHNVLGRFVLIEINHEERAVSFWLDKYRLLNPIIAQQQDEILLSNKQEECAQGQLDPIAVQSLKEFGAVVYPKTLVQGKKFLTGTALWKAKDNSFDQEDQATFWPQESLRPSVEEWVEIYETTLREMYEIWKPKFLRMSGGVDTRLIAFLLPREAQENIQGQVMCHPLLSANQDRDVLGAQQAAELTKINLSVLAPKSAGYNYVGGLEAHQRVLSGLYGGEFFGGLANNISPWLEPLLNLQTGNLLHELWRSRLEKLGSRRLTTELFLSAFRSTIYGSVYRSWSSPWELNCLALSPFVEQRVLDGILKTPTVELENYKLYASVFKKVAGVYFDYPLSSPIVAHQPGFRSFKEGIEPKSLANPTETTQAQKSLGEQNLEFFLRDYPAVKLN